MFELEVNDHISLKGLELADANALFELVDNSRETLGQWLPWVPLTKEPSDSEVFIRGAIQQYNQDNGVHYGIWYDGQLAGVIGLHYIDRTNKRTSIGYYLAQQFEGQGIMTVSTQALINYCFTELRLNRVEIRAAVNNFKSQAIPRRLGFTEEGVLRQDELLNGQFSSSYVFSLLKSEYQL
ncbi:GNAT family N-acetyltransferase [Staphylococcus simiae]|uniref:Putative acetyltransferase n=1 Tax=Staphylococcus simiae CCM 7213 = CCUG 51256 TaxID=911238 RepID=G5JHL1_9STAP|nr:GNAT family protein [Staphylococcus simiae]EHJ08317.1 putative acetyltransferase [Staphylococcus simiae CCM 7213 = CCUG 51256]PNZ09438.1 N-acetyltransferase [Staphylococcus simiae]SNV60041.1 Ribosomal-protein-L7p-serine acetyltransferase [Staphylococcus simiae]